MPRRLILTQRSVLRTVRRPMPPPTVVILDKRAKGKRKRMKAVPSTS